MCGESARTRRHASSGSSRFELAVGGRDLLGVGRAVLRLRDERRRLETPARAGAPRARPRARRRRPHRGRRSGTPPGRRSGRRRAPRPSRGSSRRSRSSPARIARSTGAAPRQRGSSDGWTFSQSERGEQSRAGCRGRRRRRRRGRRRPAAPAAPAGGRGCRARSATSFAGGAASLRPRPLRRIRAREQPGDLVGLCEALEHVGAERRRRGDADAHQRRDGARPQRRERLFAVLVVGAVDDQHAVEVVELVLHDAGAVVVELPANVVSVLRPCPRASP